MTMQHGDNPADHSVEDVNAYLATADQDERDRVLAAERADDGKQRVTVAGYADSDADASSSDGVELGAKADTESAAKGFETQDAPGSKTHSTGVVTGVGPAAGPEVTNPLADPDYVAKVSAGDGDRPESLSPEEALAKATDDRRTAGAAQTEDEKLAAIRQDRDQQNKIAAAQGVDLDALRKAEAEAAGHPVK